MLAYLCLAGGLYCTAFGVACLHLTKQRDRKLVEAEAALERRWAAFRAADHSVEVNLLAADCKLQAIEGVKQDIGAKVEEFAGHLAQVTDLCEQAEKDAALSLSLCGMIQEANGYSKDSLLAVHARATARARSTAPRLTLVSEAASRG